MSNIEDLVSRCRNAYEKGKYSDCAEAAMFVLASPEADEVAVAQVCYYKGNVEEIQGLKGAALRSWSQALLALETAGLSSHRWFGIISGAIESVQSKPTVFVSYSSSEADAAKTVLAYLRQEGIETKDYEVDFRAGERVETQILRALDQVEAVVALLSERYLRRPYTRMELAETQKRIEAWGGAGVAPRLVLIRLDHSKVPSELDALSWIDAQEGLTEEDLGKIARSVRGDMQEEGCPPEVTPERPVD